MERPRFDPSAALQIVVNGRAGHSDTEATCALIEAGLREAGRAGTVLFAAPGELARVAQEGAAKALATGSAVVAVGGDGTVNTVAQAAQETGCAMGVLPEGTFNYFAREHGVPTETAEALGWLFDARPEPVQISALNERVFLVNASVGLYPDLLQDRERWKARFGRSRLVAFTAGLSTLLRAQRHLRLSIAWDGQQRAMRTLTLFVGNNRLQLAQLGLTDTGDGRGDDTGEKTDGATTDGAAVEDETTDRVARDAHITAVILKPVSTLAMLGLILRGALGQLGDVGGIERFDCQSLVVRPSRRLGRQRVKVALDGEVRWMRSPLTIRVLPSPLWLLKATRQSPAAR